MWSLASQGVNFVNFYANNPQCTPSRSSMFAGRHTHQIKAWSNQKAIAATPGSGLKNGKWELDPGCLTNFDEEVCQEFAERQNVSDTFVDTLTEAGMDVMLFGKTDVGGNVNLRSDQKKYDPTKGGFHSRILAIVGRAADIRKKTKPRPVADENRPTKKIHAPDWQMIQECMNWLENNKKAPGQWMLYCSLVIPHPPYQCNPDTEKSVSTDVPIPEWFTTPDKYPESAMHPYDSYMSFSKGMMDEQGNHTKDQLERNMRCWYAMSNQTDQMLGMVWAKAGETGNLDNTIVIFTSDHGEMHMEHRQHLKNSMFEASARVPLIIAGPGTKPGLGSRHEFKKGRVTKDLASLVDMYPTFADAAGTTWPKDLAGFSLMPYLSEKAPTPQDHIVAMYMSNMANTNAFMIRKGPWKYLAYGKYGPPTYQSYAPQLFDLEKDPFELEDVSKNKKNAKTVKMLDDLLRSVVDYDAVDKEVKMEERMLYDRFYKTLPAKQLQAQWEREYKGFDDADAKKVQVWLQSTESAPQPGKKLVVV